MDMISEGMSIRSRLAVREAILLVLITIFEISVGAVFIYIDNFIFGLMLIAIWIIVAIKLYIDRPTVVELHSGGLLLHRMGGFDTRLSWDQVKEIGTTPRGAREQVFVLYIKADSGPRYEIFFKKSESVVTEKVHDLLQIVSEQANLNEQPSEHARFGA